MIEWQRLYRELRNELSMLRNENQRLERLVGELSNMCQSCPYHDLAEAWSRTTSGNKRDKERVNKIVRRRWAIYIENLRIMKHGH